jgi:hypothetical protein
MPRRPHRRTDSEQQPAGTSAEAGEGLSVERGTEVYPVYGSEQQGWTLDSGDLHEEVASQFRYQTLEELFFVIVNFSITTNGRA